MDFILGFFFLALVTMILVVNIMLRTQRVDAKVKAVKKLKRSNRRN